jgi:tetratricopeptide (TPR) repeat protein
MKWPSLTLTTLVCGMFLLAFSLNKPRKQSTIELKKKNIISCSPDRLALTQLLNNTDIPPMPGAGSHHWKIRTGSDSAQFYFDQGMNMYYGFHIIESMASFKKAALFDPQNPMVWWAQALALGPNINDVGYAASPAALEAVEKASNLSGKATAIEKMLITAMSVRYSADSMQRREKLNQDYADRMNKAYQQFPHNADVAALYADALMLQHPWDLWNMDGTAKPWTPRIRKLLENILIQSPNHPGANHYYIHVLEASPDVHKAVASADRLGKLTPGLSHMVHMPSHIYLRVGQYEKGSRVNEEAVKQFSLYSNLFPAVSENAFLYQWHNLHLQTTCALLAGSYKYAKQSALYLRAALDTNALSMAAPLGSYVQYLYMTPVFIDVRYGKWNDLLAMPAPAKLHTYARILYHFGRGMAYSAYKDFIYAEKEKKQLRELMKDSGLAVPIKPFSPAIQGAKCAEQMLSGFISLKQNKVNNAIQHFENATKIERNMTYNEPRDWLVSPKQYLGVAYLSGKNYSAAQKIFESDLKVNADNVWSLFGLEQSLLKQKKGSEAIKVKKKLEKNLRTGDTNPEIML